jgi:penicillin amidase
MGKTIWQTLVGRLFRRKVQPPDAAQPRRGWARRTARALALLLGVAVAAGLLVYLWARTQVRGSLPRLDGELHVAGLTGDVRVERDGLGIPTIRGRDRTDVAFATGFVHGQDRFFQMDLMRRHAAGELAELFGAAAVPEDRRLRGHRFRDVAGRVVEASGEQDRRLLTAYARGVEAGRRSLDRPPFEYLALGVEPAPWTEADTVLAILSMFWALQSGAVVRESTRGLLYDTLPGPLADFLSPAGTRWDAPLEGPAFEVPPVPGPEVLDLRKRPRKQQRPADGLRAEVLFDDVRPGSNNWAVAGRHTAHGGAIVANDMHLAITVPGTWYRAMLVWPGEGTAENRMIGITLPGAPAVVVGSNTHVAWGFTNTEGDWSDLVLLDPDPKDPDRYLTPGGPKPLEKHAEVIKVRGGPDVTLEVDSTIWGPVVDRDHKGRRRALHWAAHDPAAINLELMRLESARNLEGALAVAHGTGLPAQNFVAADARGGIAWTVAGRIPRRTGFDGRVPASWADGRRRWDGWLDVRDYPAVVNPPGGRIWTANNRVVNGPALDRIGRGNYDLGARAGQIRDQLRADKRFRETDMLAIQLDDRALFLTRWQELLLGVLKPEALAADPGRGPLRQAVAGWGGRASIESAGYRIVRRFRQRVLTEVLEALTEPCKKAYPLFAIGYLSPTVEGSVWRLVTERPPHLVPAEYTTWDALLLGAADAVRKEVQGNARSLEKGLEQYTWGAYSTVRVRHPFSRASSLLSWWLDLDMRPREMPGDSAHMPRIQSRSAGDDPSEGASQRMAVSPGREEEGYFHMPAGQSGHPLSSHYRDGHEAWVRGEPTPFLPGPPVHVLVLKPAR